MHRIHRVGSREDSAQPVTDSQMWGGATDHAFLGIWILLSVDHILSPFTQGSGERAVEFIRAKFKSSPVQITQSSLSSQPHIPVIMVMVQMVVS